MCYMLRGGERTACDQMRPGRQVACSGILLQTYTKQFHWFRRPPGRRVHCPNCSPESPRLAACSARKWRLTDNMTVNYTTDTWGGCRQGPACPNAQLIDCQGASADSGLKTSNTCRKRNKHDNSGRHGYFTGTWYHQACWQATPAIPLWRYPLEIHKARNHIVSVTA